MNIYIYIYIYIIIYIIIYTCMRVRACVRAHMRAYAPFPFLLCRRLSWGLRSVLATKSWHRNWLASLIRRTTRIDLTLHTCPPSRCPTNVPTCVSPYQSSWVGLFFFSEAETKIPRILKSFRSSLSLVFYISSKFQCKIVLHF